MSVSDNSGSLLSVDATDIDEMAVRISDMWLTYNQARVTALALGEEARAFVFATDVDQTTASILPHVNRTHQPKLTQISDTLQSQYFEASLSMPIFFKFDVADRSKYDSARKIEAWVRTKLEQRKFRETTGRALIADYVNYGNCFVSVDYVVEKDENGNILYKGPEWKRISPLDMVFNPHAESFAKSPKITKALIHIAEVAEWPDRFPNGDFDAAKIKRAVEYRTNEFLSDWIEVIKERGIKMDGYGGFNSYFKSDTVEVLIYRGDVFDPVTGKVQRNRVIYVLDRCMVVRNAPSRSPAGFDGVHHAGWRIRNDNLWAQGALDNLVGLQFRIDHLENLKADVFDQIAHPIIKIKGNDVIEPAGGFRPGAAYYTGLDGDVDILKPDATALNANTELAHYHKMMEDFAGAPPETRGIRTPGEKTAFEVNKLDQAATMMFVDKARNFERMIETMLKETFDLMLKNYDGGDYVEIFDDIKGESELKLLSVADVNALGTFTAEGARFWTRRNRESLEMQQFMAGPMQDPKIRSHVDGWALATYFNRKLMLDNEDIFIQYGGVKEDVQLRAIAAAEQKKLEGSIGQDGNARLNPDQTGQPSPSAPDAVQPQGVGNRGAAKSGPPM
jgi:hypothetical protein